MKQGNKEYGDKEHCAHGNQHTSKLLAISTSILCYFEGFDLNFLDKLPFWSMYLGINLI